MLEMMPDCVDSVGRDGFAVIEKVVDPGTVDELIAAIDRAGPLDALLRREEEVYGMRDLLRSIPAVRALAGSACLLDLVERVLGPGAFAVRGLLFDKTARGELGRPLAPGPDDRGQGAGRGPGSAPGM